MAPLRSCAGVMLAAALAVSASIPAAHAVDADDIRIVGLPIVGSTLGVLNADVYVSVCGGDSTQYYQVQWLKDGQPEVPDGSPYTYELESGDVGSRISAIVTGPQVCEPSRFVVESPVISKQPVRADGFTGRSAFELLGRRHDGTLALYLGQAEAKGWKETREVGPGWNALSRIVGAGDFASDGVNDLIVIDATGTLYKFNGTGDGGFHTYRVASGWGWNAIDQVVGPGDWDGDGRNDLLATEENGDLFIYPSSWWGGWSPREKVGRGWDVMDLLIGPGDWDGDGNVDVLAKDKSGRLFFYGGDGHGGWTTSRQIGQGWNALRMVGSGGDFNRDGFNDVHGVNAAGDLLMYYGDGRGGWKGVETVGWGWNVFNGLY